MHRIARTCAHLLAIIPLVTSIAPAGHSQEMAMAVSLGTPMVPHANARRGLLDRQAGLAVENSTLVAALNELRHRAGVPIVYSEDFLPPEVRVTCECLSASVRQALTRLLSGTQLRYVDLGTQVLVEPTPSPSVQRIGVGGPAVAGDSLDLLSAGGELLYPAVEGGVSGKVVDRVTRAPLLGAQVFAEGTSIGAMTDSAGAYTLANLPDGQATIRVRMIGYAPASRTATVAAGQTTHVDFELDQQALGLDEVVVTGTAGQSRKREVGNSIAAVDGARIAATPARDLQDVINGQVAGATVLANSGQPGAGGTILLRGNTSLSQGNMPLVYVDGVRVYSEGGPGGSLPLNDISADQIARVEVVRGPAATTLYGTEAAGGVIQIFTKRGAAGPPSWNAEVQTGFNSLDLTSSDNPTGFFLNKCTGPDLVTSAGDTFEDVTCPESGSWLSNGLIQRYSLSVRGGAGDPNIAYFLSGSYADEDGVVKPGGSKNGALRANLSFDPAGKVKISTNVGYTHRSTRWVPDGNYLGGFLLNVMRGPRNNYKVDGKPANASILDQDYTNGSDHFILGMTVNHQTTESIVQKFTVGYDYVSVNNQTVVPFAHITTPKGSISLAEARHTTLSLDYGGTWTHDLGRRLNSAFSWGGQIFQDNDQRRNLTGRDFAGPGDPTITSAAQTSVGTDQRLRVINAGGYLQEVLGFDNLLFLTAGLRVDGNSAFGRDFGLQPYPKVSASYIISDHEFWPDNSWLGSMKLRAAYGESGKAPGAFDAVRTWDPIAGDDGQPAFTPSQIGNPDLGPERTRELEVGMNAGFLRDRLVFDFTYFRQRTTDALVAMAGPPSNGFLNRQLENVGTLSNQGFEAQLDARLLHTEKVLWTAQLSYSKTKSKAVDLGGQVINVGSSRWYNTLKEGYPVPSFFGTVITNPDEIADPILAEDQFIGPAYPTKTATIGTEVTLFGWLTVAAQGAFQGGNYQQNASGFQNNVRSVWPPCYAVQKKLRAAEDGDASALAGVTARERAHCALSTNPLSSEADFWTEKADFFKLRNLSFTFNLPARWVPGAQSASLMLAGRNLFTITDYDGLDPEVNDFGYDLNRQEYYNLPPTRSFLARLRIGF
jgi:outer membrane receptor protein involved in Fe transport